MFEPTYQWKVDFAIILSFVALLISIIRWYLDKRNKRKSRVLEAYEKVFDDAMYILLYPRKYRRELANQKQFIHPDPIFEKAVRNYLDSHILVQLSYDYDEYMPSNINSHTDKQKYLSEVAVAASKFSKEVSDLEFNLELPNLSPVYYIENEDILKRLQNIINNVGKNLSLFSEMVRDFWSDTLTGNPKDVKNEYEKGLAICPHFFSHNPRDFDDPYFDLVSQIRNDYNKMTRKKLETISSKIRYYGFRILHPIQAYKIYKENKNFLT